MNLTVHTLPLTEFLYRGRLALVFAKRSCSSGTFPLSGVLLIMSSLVLSTTPSDPTRSGARPSSTDLINLPPDAMILVYRVSTDPTQSAPIAGEPVHISEVIPGDGPFVLLSFSTTATDDWPAIERELLTAQRMGITPLLVARVNAEQRMSALFKSGPFSRVKDIAPVLYEPSRTLAKLLKVEGSRHADRTKMGLVLIRDGSVAVTWTAQDDGYDSSGAPRPFDWTTILSLVG